MSEASCPELKGRGLLLQTAIDMSLTAVLNKVVKSHRWGEKLCTISKHAVPDDIYIYIFSETWIPIICNQNNHTKMWSCFTLFCRTNCITSYWGVGQIKPRILSYILKIPATEITNTKIVQPVPQNPDTDFYVFSAGFGYLHWVTKLTDCSSCWNKVSLIF